MAKPAPVAKEAPVVVPPVGSIIAWHKNMGLYAPPPDALPPLPPDWKYSNYFDPIWMSELEPEPPLEPEPELITLPPEWVECDGTPITDPDSPFDGMNSPQLNTSQYSTTTAGLFLRGSNLSGWKQRDTMEGHIRGAGHR